MAVETYDWIDTTNLSALVANFARVHMLLSMFDGEPQKWIEFLECNGTDEERRRDGSFIQRRSATIARGVTRSSGDKPQPSTKRKSLLGTPASLVRNRRSMSSDASYDAGCAPAERPLNSISA